MRGKAPDGVVNEPDARDSGERRRGGTGAGAASHVWAAYPSPTIPEYQPGYDFLADLERRGLLEGHGHRLTTPVPFQQPVDAYIEHWHSRASLARVRMTAQDALEFDERLRELVAPHADDGGRIEQQIADIRWGCPQAAPKPRCGCEGTSRGTF